MAPEPFNPRRCQIKTRQVTDATSERDIAAW